MVHSCVVVDLIVKKFNDLLSKLDIIFVPSESIELSGNFLIIDIENCFLVKDSFMEQNFCRYNRSNISLKYQRYRKK